MLSNTVSIEEFRTHFADLFGKVIYDNNRVIIKRYNKKAAVLINVSDFEKLLDPTRRLSKTQWKREIEKLESIRACIPDTELESLQREIDLVVKGIRADNKRTSS